MSMKVGATFSNKYCFELGLEPLAALEEILKMLPLQTVRLCAYWDEIEQKEGNFDFSLLDGQIKLIGKKTDLVIALGRKVPRWPEFHEPVWALSKDKEFLISALQNYIKKTVEKYKSLENLKMWQVENEPFVKFGQSQHPFSEKDLELEVALVRELDDRP